MEQKKGESSIAPVPKVNERDVSVDLPLRGKKILPSYKTTHFQIQVASLIGFSPRRSSSYDTGILNLS